MVKLPEKVTRTTSGFLVNEPWAKDFGWECEQWESDRMDWFKKKRE